MKNDDKKLGMDRDISRRDFLEGSLQLTGGVAVAAALPAISNAATPIGMARSKIAQSSYPPSGLGLRGSHAGSFETAHQLALEGKTDWGDAALDDATEYDLVVIGAGISGLSAAYFYQEQHPDARILILENHDDFGGHAKRNEFDWGDRTILGYGGSQSLEAPSAYSEQAKSLLTKLTVDVTKLGEQYDQGFFKRHGLGSAIYFDEETYGRDATVRSQFIDASLFLPLAESSVTALASIDQMPINDNAKAQLKRVITLDVDKLPDHSIFSEPEYLQSISYLQFLTRHLGVTEPAVLNLLKHVGNSYFGYDMGMISAFNALAFGQPGLSATSLGTFKKIIEKLIQWSTEPYIYHFPDGNASIARLLVHGLIPEAAQGQQDMDSIVTALFDYSALDSPDSNVRLRLSSTVVNVVHDGPATSASGVLVNYVANGGLHRVSAKQAILACYNMAIPHICPELPTPQKEALAKLVKFPMCSTNVLLRDWKAIKESGFGILYSPNKWNKTIVVDFPVSMGGYQFAHSPNDPIILHGLRGVAGPGKTPQEQSRSGRHEMLMTDFEDYERDIRSHLAGALSNTGFDPARDIAGITVNRWPHGYAWRPNPLFDPAYEEGSAPNEVGRKRYGNIAIANSDAGARAYLDCAIDEAWRAVGELS